MATEKEQLAANVVGPKLGEIAAIAVTSTSDGTNLAAAAQLGEIANAGHYLTFVADGGDIDYFFTSSDTGTADPTAATGDGRSAILKDGVPVDMCLPRDTVGVCSWVVAVTDTTATLRVWKSSEHESR